MCSFKTLAFFLVTLLFSAEFAYAQQQVTSNLNQNQTYQFESNTTACLQAAPAGSGISKKQWTQQIYTGRLVYCMRQLLNAATKVFLNKVTEDFGLAVLGASAIFAFALFGVRLSLGMLQNLKSEGFTFLLKIGIVFFFLNNTDFLVDFWFDTLDMFLELVAFGMKDLLTNMSCPAVIGSMHEWFQVWSQFDCLFSKFVGFGTSAMGAGVLATAGLLVYSGGWGLWAANMAFAAFYAVAQFLFRCAMVALLSYGGLAIMLMLLPLFLPMVLFKRTEDFIYKAWLPFAIGFVLQPAICIAFMLFALNVFDQIIMTGTTGIYMQIRAETNEVIYTSDAHVKPRDSEDAVKHPDKIRGIDTYSSEDVQKVQIKKTVKKVQRSMTTVQQTTNNEVFSERDCGQLGRQQASENEVSQRAGANADQFMGCTNPAKCAEAHQQNLPNAPSQGTANTARDIACDTAKLNADGAAAQGVYNLGQQEATLTTESLDLGADQEKGVAQLLAYYGLLMITAGIFFKMIEHVPSLARGISSSSSPKISLHSPSVAGQKLSDRLQSALTQQHKNVKGKLAENKVKGGEKNNVFERAWSGGYGGFIKTLTRRQF